MTNHRILPIALLLSLTTAAGANSLFLLDRDAFAGTLNLDGPPPPHASAPGSLLSPVACSVCQSGEFNSPGEALSFTFSAPAGLTAREFVANDRGYLFAPDIRGKPGTVRNLVVLAVPFIVPEAAVIHTTAEVPEPATFLLIGAGLVGLGCLRKHALR